MSTLGRVLLGAAILVVLGLIGWALVFALGAMVAYVATEVGVGAVIGCIGAGFLVALAIVAFFPLPRERRE